MEKLINEINNAIKNIEERLERIEQALNLKRDHKATTGNYNNNDVSNIVIESLNEWELVKLALKGHLNDVSYKTWIEPIFVVKSDERDVTFSVPSEFHKGILEQRYINVIKNAFKNITGKDYEIRFLVVKTLQNEGEAVSIDIGNCNKFVPSQFNPQYLFENMVVGAGNELAYKSALKVAQYPNGDMKLLYIYGEVGMGKTHLLNSIGNYIADNNSATKVIYITLENFVNELVQSIAQDKQKLFNSKFYNADVLIFDNLQQIAGKERTQEEFRNVVNTALTMGKQVVLASTKPLHEMQLNGNKLESVFEISAAFQLTKLDLTTRIQILKIRANKERDLIIDDDTISSIAKNVDTNVRELIGAYNRVISYISIVGKKIDREKILSIL